MKLINKDALVAEIEKKLKNVNLNYISAGSHPSATDTNKKLQDGISKDLQSLLSFINTLEVKEVELEKPEDVRIRKNTIEIVRQSMNGVDVALPLSIYKECIAWLEKKDEKDNV